MQITENGFNNINSAISNQDDDCHLMNLPTELLWQISEASEPLSITYKTPECNTKNLDEQIKKVKEAGRELVNLSLSCKESCKKLIKRQEKLKATYEKLVAKKNETTQFAEEMKSLYGPYIHAAYGYRQDILEKNYRRLATETLKHLLSRHPESALASSEITDNHIKTLAQQHLPSAASPRLPVFQAAANVHIPIDIVEFLMKTERGNEDGPEPIQLIKTEDSDNDLTEEEIGETRFLEIQDLAKKYNYIF